MAVTLTYADFRDALAADPLKGLPAETERALQAWHDAATRMVNDYAPPRPR